MLFLTGCAPSLYYEAWKKCGSLNCANDPNKNKTELSIIQNSVAPNWNDFYQSGTNQTCVGTESNCVHGGELKQIIVSGKTSCDGLRLEDDLLVFDWKCSLTDGKILFNGSLKEDKGLAQLIDAPSLSWKPNFVRIYDGSALTAQSNPAAWWTNSIQEIPDSTASVVVLATPSIIYVAKTSFTSMGYHISAPKVSILLPIGVTIKGVTNANFNYGSASMTSPNQSSVFVVEKQPFVSIEGDNFWTFADMSTTQWNIDGDLKAMNLITARDSNYLRIKKLNLINSAQNAILPNGSFGMKVSRINLKGSKVYGLRDQDVRSAEYKNLNIYNGLNGAVVSFSSHDSSYSNLFFANEVYGFSSGEASNARVDNVVATNISGIGTSMRSSVGGKYSNFYVHDSGYGIYLYGTSIGNNISKMQFIHNLGSGAYSEGTMNNSTFDDITAVNNGFGGTGDDDAIFESVTSLGGNVYKNINTANNKGNGMTISSKGAVLQNIISVNNGLDGIKISAALKSVVLATIMNNSRNGINQDFADAATTYHQVVSVNNGGDGFLLRSETLGSTLTQIVSANNGGFGINIGDTTVVAKVKLGGQLFVSSNLLGACRLSSGGVLGISNTSCTGSSPSNVTVNTPSTVISSFVGPLAASTDTRKINETITNWSIGSSFKEWGKDAGGRGPCLAGEYCQQNDFSLNLSDTILKNSTGNGTAQNQSFLSGISCPSAVNGNINQTIFNGAITYLLNAVEDTSSTAVNKNGLCESGESCIYTPNFGAYQGDGDLSSCVFNSMGWLDNISVKGYLTNGR